MYWVSPKCCQCFEGYPQPKVRKKSRIFRYGLPEDFLSKGQKTTGGGAYRAPSQWIRGLRTLGWVWIRSLFLPVIFTNFYKFFVRLVHAQSCIFLLRFVLPSQEGVQQRVQRRLRSQVQLRLPTVRLQHQVRIQGLKQGFWLATKDFLPPSMLPPHVTQLRYIPTLEYIICNHDSNWTWVV